VVVVEGGTGSSQNVAEGTFDGRNFDHRQMTDYYDDDGLALLDHSQCSSSSREVVGARKGRLKRTEVVLVRTWQRGLFELSLPEMIAN